MNASNRICLCYNGAHQTAWHPTILKEGSEVKIFTLTVISLLALLGLSACGGAEENGMAQPQPTTIAIPSEANPIVTATESGPAPCYPSGPETDEIQAPFADFDLALKQVRLYDSDLPPSVSRYFDDSVGNYRWYDRRELAEQDDQPFSQLQELRRFGLLGTATDQYTAGMSKGRIRMFVPFKMVDPAPGIDEIPIPAILYVTIYFFADPACTREFAQAEFAGWQDLEPSPTAPEQIEAGYYWQEQETVTLAKTPATQTTTRVALLLHQVTPGSVIIKAELIFRHWDTAVNPIVEQTPSAVEAIKGLDSDILDAPSLAETLARRYEQTVGFVFQE